MKFEHFNALVGVMTNEQYNKLEARVFDLLKEGQVFSKAELRALEAKAEAVGSFKQEVVMN
jgi:hypothetical protein